MTQLHGGAAPIDIHGIQVQHFQCGEIHHRITSIVEQDPIQIDSRLCTACGSDTDTGKTAEASGLPILDTTLPGDDGRKGIGRSFQFDALDPTAAGGVFFSNYIAGSVGQFADDLHGTQGGIDLRKRES